ncbi:hypothetical protein [Caulobacter sp. LARHSG274]
MAAGLSAAVHAVLAVILLWPHAAPNVREPQAIEVELVTPRRDRTPAPAGTRPRRARPERPVAAAVAPSSPVTVTPPPVLAPSAAPPSAPAEAAAAASLQRALRGAIGCGHADLLGLSPAEQRRCRDQQAQGLEPRPGQPSFGMDPRKRAVFAAEAKEREPFLIQTPKNGCKPRVAQKEVGMAAGATHDWTAGISCAKSF